MPPDAARDAIRIANRVAIVYTSAQKRRREHIFADLCTLLRPHVCPQRRDSVHKRPTLQPAMPRKGALWGCRPHGKAHSGRATSRKGAFCVRALPKGALCMRAVVAPRGHFRRSVYTHACPRLLARPGGSMDPSTPTAPWPRDARALGPEAHATGTVTQPSTHTSSRSLILVRKPLAMPVVPAVVPPLSPFRDGSSRPATGGAEGRLRRPRGAGATGGDGLSHTSRHCACRVARVPRRRGRVPCGETEGEVGGTPGMPAGAGMVEERLPRPHAHLPPGCVQARRRATWWAGRGAWARPCRASGTMSGGPCGRGPDDVGEGPPRGHRRPRRADRREARPTAV